ncbi:phosphotransferase [Streptomyces sp. BH-SS-21]|uniref:Phosphotransferase n=1 Tax=Streptomyces liliiviolaceus TaxID=2823109 RepID=A0A940Y4H1_9ACTN|nr:phosphotransferase [Streptomyces liliiviolaceus]MBQ0852876.1 phosphotransferase [Streptomyces liliiviolaceus]
MTATMPVPGGFDEFEMYEVLEQACEAAGLDCSDARLLRGHTNAVVLLGNEGVVVKIARRGSRIEDVTRTVRFVSWLMDSGFPTVPLHGIEQPIVIDRHAVTFWTYLFTPEHGITAQGLAKPLYSLHTLGMPPFNIPRHDNLQAIRNSIASITSLPDGVIQFLSECADRLERELVGVEFELSEGVIQGDPQHRNALYAQDGEVVLCDWDTVAIGQPEWDLVTIEVHCRRFGHGGNHYRAFADAYGFDVTCWTGYATLSAIRELRMITTNARKTHHSPGSLAEVERRVEGLKLGDRMQTWNIL